ncbi:GGDEF domain-containing protein [Undibacterium arcticum]|uniref:GGDEF domain-containing protein n=1 Tax=Undibacterium arcticum TaxID=1762892 RepID=UPI00361DF5E4
MTEPALALGSGKDVVIPPFHVREADEVGKALLKASEMLRHAQHQANHDVLTGLANRALFKEILNQQLSVCERNGTHLSVLYIDLDGFKTINDQHGHATGDRLLQEVAKRLKAGIRESDVAARLGGDEFAVVLVGACGETAMKVAEKLVETVSAPYAIDHATVNITASIGVAAYPECGGRSKDLLRLADGAMYQAKKAGKRRVMSATTSSPIQG